MLDNNRYTCTIIDMDLVRPFRVVTPTVDGDVLAVLAGADAAFTAPRVQALIGERSIDGVRKSLNRLEGEGIVLASRTGNAWSYRLNRDHLAAPPIVALAKLRQELFQRIEAKLHRWRPRTEFAALFGSGATHHMSSRSDLDVFIVRPDDIDVDDNVWRQQLDGLASDITSWTGNDARILEYGASETADALRTGTERVLADIRSQGIVLAGPRHYLDNLARTATRR